MTLGWSLQQVADATGGTVHAADPAAPLVASVGTDSRASGPGELFVAIAGESFDGHDFAAAAIAAGAVAAVVRRDAGWPAAMPRIEVDDTAEALRDLAARHRRAMAIPVVAVTGSTGKTSTKDLLAAALPGAHASPRSYNNEVGVPLTVLGTPDTARHLVLEVGSRGRGHIAWLGPAVAPDVAVVTNLGVVHLETFGTTDDLADAKFELVELLGPAGTAVLPAAEPRLHRPPRGATDTGGTGPDADVAVSRLDLDAGARPSFHLDTPVGSVDVTLPVPGAHQALNAAAATAAGVVLGVPLADLAAGLERVQPSPWRMEIHQGRFTVVNDAYNANPDSVLAALEAVAAMPGRSIAVLGRMAELGPVEAEEHRRMGAEARRLGFATVVVVGDDPGIAAGAGDIALPAADPVSARRLVGERAGPGDVVLVKASRAVGLEKLAAALAEDAAS